MGHSQKSWTPWSLWEPSNSEYSVKPFSSQKFQKSVADLSSLALCFYHRKQSSAVVQQSEAAELQQSWCNVVELSVPGLLQCPWVPPLLQTDPQLELPRNEPKQLCCAWEPQEGFFSTWSKLMEIAQMHQVHFKILAGHSRLHLTKWQDFFTASFSI